MAGCRRADRVRMADLPRECQSVTMASVAVFETSRPRPGRRFDPTHELALLNSAMMAAGQLPGARRGVIIVPEMTGPYGIPDLTALVGDPAALAARLELAVPPLLHEVDAGVVAVAHVKRPSTPRDLSISLGWPEETVVRRLPSLVRAGALCEVRSNGFVRPRALAPLGRLYAIEAKVRDWRRGVRQARTYGVWADSYVLIMGELALSAVRELTEEVRGDSGGLVVQGRWVRRPGVRAVPLKRRLWATEHLVAAIQDDPHQPSPVP